MKKLICSLLALLVVLSTSAALGENLLQMWEELGGYPSSFYYYYEEPDVYDIVDNSTPYSIDGHAIGEMAQAYLNLNEDYSNFDCEDLICSLTFYAKEFFAFMPLLTRLESRISSVDAQLLNSELYKWIREEDGFESWEEYYLIQAKIDLAEGHMEYHFLVQISTDTYGEGGTNYYLLAINGADPAEVDSSEYETYEPYMQVVNCDEWVSLRFSPDNQSERLAKVPLGAVVEDVYSFDCNSFFYCSYNGHSGYILRDYLQPYKY